MKPLTRHEIFDLAAAMATGIKAHLDDKWYDKSGVTFSIGWSTRPELDAHAIVSPTLEAPEQHRIVLSYSLVEYIYSEALDFAMFARWPKDHEDRPVAHTIPEQFEMLQAAQFMFESGIAFVIFHELGHLNQSHGLIRSKYDPAGSDPTIVSEFAAVHGHEKITGDYATVHHATELAADFEALDWMSNGLELMFKGEDFIDHAYLQCAIVSCIMLVFNGDRPLHIDPQPIGSHPHPLPRMDFWVKAYAERMRIRAEALEITTSNDDITKRFMDASFWALMKWITRLQLPEVPQYTDFFKGAVAHPDYATYMREVVNLWTAEYQQARSSRKFGAPLSVLYYADEFRDKIGAVKNRESLMTHVQRTLNAVVPA